ncbi:MAG TPA: SAM-dependent methyltransferase [Thermoanaerobaculia bacterium]|jgi:uncharacterized protein YabN with tetrapyrrole methylase and pyrophosphatase domain|nr:SAM-dependent methyltransferase [Thermoanaerobaculia bacterium]
MAERGSLVLVGSGIKSLAHMTVEAQAWIRRADVVLYCVSDPATEVWIKQNCEDSRDLVALYNAERKRSETYGDMVSHIMSPVREGKLVCAVFYGHPGLFVNPSHKAIQVARSEGYPAFMLPGVSAADCLYADVGFDPAVAGCQFYEATDLLVHKRILHPDNNVIIWQVGCVGDLSSRVNSANSNLVLLAEYLEQFYDPECEIVLYQGSLYPVCDDVVERISLKKLAQARVSTMSTLYIPPQKKADLDKEMALRLGVMQAEAQGEKKAVVPAPQSPTVSPSLDQVTVQGRSALAEFVLAAAADSDLLQEFRSDPGQVAARAGLSAQETEALLSRQGPRISRAIRLELSRTQS